ncbi:MAG: TIGR04076 family protein [Woeseiales bacterium]
MTDNFELWNLKVEIVGDETTMICKHTVGDSFKVCGEDITFSTGQSFSMYALAAILPLLPAKQRQTHENDWMIRLWYR